MENFKTIQKKYSIHGIEFTAFDIESSDALDALETEFNLDLMKVNELSFSENPIIIDIGANLGVVSFYFAKKYPNATIYAYEPHPVNFKNIIKGIEKNKLTNVYAFNLAVMSESGLDVKIYLHENNTSGSSMFRYYATDPYVKVKTVSLEDIIKNNKLPYIDFLKIDCEGAEFDILENTNMLYEGEIHIENIFVEFHRFMETKENKSIENVLNKMKTYKNCNLENIRTITF